MYREKLTLPLTAVGVSSPGMNLKKLPMTQHTLRYLMSTLLPNYDPEIIPLLDKQIGTAWRRNAAREWEAEAFPVPPPSH